MVPEQKETRYPITAGEALKEIDLCPRLVALLREVEA